MDKRFRVIYGADAKAQGIPGINNWTEDYTGLLFDFSTDPPSLIASDGMEPEDVCFDRDLEWVPKLLNELNAEIVRLKEESYLTSLLV